MARYNGWVSIGDDACSRHVSGKPFLWAVAEIGWRYLVNWEPCTIRVQDLHPNYRLIFVFHAVPSGNGNVFFTAPPQSTNVMPIVKQLGDKGETLSLQSAGRTLALRLLPEPNLKTFLTLGRLLPPL